MKALGIEVQFEKEGVSTNDPQTDMILGTLMAVAQQEWEYDEELYKRRNEVERFFRRIKRFRRVFTRYDKLDIVFAGFILFAMIVDALV